MTDFATLVAALRSGQPPDADSVRLVARGATDLQLAALAAHLAFSPSADEPTVYGVALPPGGYLEGAGLATGPARGDPFLTSLLKDVSEERRLGGSYIQRFVSDLSSGRVDPNFLAIWLVAVTWHGLSRDDTHELTQAMASSGRTFDYRNEPLLGGRRIVRRYATGALSEKVALILPSLIASASGDRPVATAFLVSKSLSFTGGTWDKLSAIPGFQFPEPGDDTVRALTDCGAAMTVTHGDFCPADRVLYQLRSVTGTVESRPLIVSSIASKHLASPAHRLLLDVRYGPGAFLEERDYAADVGEDIAAEVRAAGTAVDVTLTGAEEPTGSALGNALEVAEALAIINPVGTEGSSWDHRGLDLQRRLVLDMYTKLMAAEFSDMDVDAWRSDGAERLDSGRALDGFNSLLRAHGVKPDVATAVTRTPLTELAAPPAAVVTAAQTGYVRGVDQRRLGNIVNFELGAGGNEFGGRVDLGAGIILSVHVGDRVEADGRLCQVYSRQAPDAALLGSLRSCFDVATDALRTRDAETGGDG